MSAASVHVAQLQAKLLDKMVDARANILEFFQLICKIKAETWCSTTKKHNGTRVWVLSEQPCKLASQVKPQFVRQSMGGKPRTVLAQLKLNDLSKTYAGSWATQGACAKVQAASAQTALLQAKPWNKLMGICVV
eukprot:scaffold37701_cov17-Tisochrysis_lutea.AAC.2